MTPEYQAGPPARFEPQTAWTELTEAPLKGLGFAREAGAVFAWDDADQLYLIDLKGGFRSVARAPGKVIAAAISDDGSRVAIIGEKSQLWLLDADLGVIAQRQGPPDPLGVAIDPHGRYVLVSSKLSSNHFYNRFGKPAGRFETLQPLAFMAFVPGEPLLVGSATSGMLLALELGNAGSGRLTTDPVWQERQVSGVGRLTTSGDGAMILASCFTHGIQRYDIHGQNAGAYHLGGTATHAVPDYPGRIIAVATSEGEIAVLNSAGNVRWKAAIPRPAIALETDPLGRYLIYGQATGEIVKLDLYASGRETAPPSRTPSGSPRSAPREVSQAANSRGATIRKPDWSLAVALTDVQAETSVLAVLDEPPRISLFTSSLKMQILSTQGQNLGFAPEILGIGRILRTAPGWIAAATDRQIVLYNTQLNAAQRLELSLVEITHLVILPDTFGLAIVQERDRLGRATIAGRWIWKHGLKSSVEDVAIGTGGHCAVTTDAGTLLVFDPAGLSMGTYQADSIEPLCLITAVDDSPSPLSWMTLARRSQVLRGHDLSGRVLWESPVAWEGWQFHRCGSIAMISAPDGKVLAFDGAGHLRGQGRSSGSGKDLFTTNPRGEPRRISREGVHLICSDFDGRVRWRSVCDEPLGPVAVGLTGVAAMVGRSIAWFEGLDGADNH